MKKKSVLLGSVLLRPLVHRVAVLLFHIDRSPLLLDPLYPLLLLRVKAYDYLSEPRVFHNLLIHHCH